MTVCMWSQWEPCGSSWNIHVILAKIQNLQELTFFKVLSCSGTGCNSSYNWTDGMTLYANPLDIVQQVLFWVWFWSFVLIYMSQVIYFSPIPIDPMTVSELSIIPGFSFMMFIRIPSVPHFLQILVIHWK